MIVHIGNEISIKSSDVIGIFDMENTSTGSITREFLNSASSNFKVVNVSYNMPKSFILCQNSKGERLLYITNVSVSTLKNRFNS
ncbi:MAG: DUF370 domain-containing protein [Ruminococcus sp.]|nr:DUF370 domain-containing protein [Ruminococcus sp.]MCD7801119.1 DUF370 domain-containing protein [Ruminococcus sp.]